MLNPKTEVAEIKTWRIDSASVIEIAGSTNISTFRCEATKYQGGGLLKETVYPERNVSEWNGVIILHTAHFDCFNSIMTKDFRETLQFEDHPTISVRFINLVKESETINQQNLRGEVEITLAGVSKIYPISCAFLAKNGKKAFLTGERKLTFTDFKLDPPVKFLGTIKVKDSIKVNFALVLEEQS
ncbi:YceI family protein [Algoriphagus ratkowskyi]|nr:YceI family protein [Algoriphagus ratkowskyi]TXD77864.1 YceI family protein [Algoriphagus ratkowskyi]